MKSNQATKLEPNKADLTFPELDLEKIYWDSEKQIKEGKLIIMNDAFFDNWKQELKTEFGSR